MDKSLKNISIMNFVFAILVTAINFSCASEVTTEETVVEDVMVFDETPLENILEEHNIKTEGLSVFIDKSDFQLSIMHADTVVKWFPVVLGYNPEGDKMQEGDYKTPEGVFGIRDKYPHKSWKYFIWIDYPNEESWERFEQRKADGTISDDARIGGEIGIHGTPEGMDALIDDGQNWTFGCVSLKRSHVEEIYPYFHKNIKITIQQ
jgi:murein L,D-transpeptidase YafK